MPLAFRNLKLKTQLSFRERLRQIDWVGSVLSIVGPSSFLIGLTWGGVQYSWSSFKTWLPILLGVLSIAAFLVYEALVPTMPVVRLSIFNTRSGALIFILTAFFGFEVSHTNP